MNAPLRVFVLALLHTFLQNFAERTKRFALDQLTKYNVGEGDYHLKKRSKTISVVDNSIVRPLQLGNKPGVGLNKQTIG